MKTKTDEEWGVIKTEITPYQDEPFATDGETSDGDSEEERDVNGLTPSVLERRYEELTVWILG